MIAVWLYEAAEGDASFEGGIRYVTLGADGRPASPIGAFSPGASVTDMGLDCSLDVCRAVVVVAQNVAGGGSRVSLWSLSGLGSASSESLDGQLLLPLWTSSPEGVSPTLVSDRVYFADRVAPGQAWHLQRAELKWSEP